MKKENTDKKKFAAVTAAAVCMSLVIVIISTGVFTAISLVRNLKTIDNYQSSLEEATALECEIKDLYRQISDSTDNLVESVKNLDLIQSLSEIEKLKSINILNRFIAFFNQTERNINVCTINTISIFTFTKHTRTI